MYQDIYIIAIPNIKLKKRIVKKWFNKFKYHGLGAWVLDQNIYYNNPNCKVKYKKIQDNSKLLSIPLFLYFNPTITI